MLYESCLLLSKQERGTSKKEKLHSNLASQYTHLEVSRNGDLTVDFTSLEEFRVDVEAAGGDITCRCCQWYFMKAGTRTVPFPQPIIGVPGLITPEGKKCSSICLIAYRLLSRAHIQGISFTFFVYFEPCTNSMWLAFTLVCPISFSVN